jgi:hypothetical protein
LDEEFTLNKIIFYKEEE